MEDVSSVSSSSFSYSIYTNFKFFFTATITAPCSCDSKTWQKTQQTRRVLFQTYSSRISVSFQRSFLYYANWFSLLTLLLSIWCFVSNAIVIIGLLRSGIRSLRPGLLIVCSLAFSDLMWGATVAPIYTGFSEVSWQMYEMVETNFGNTSHDVFSNPPRDHQVLPNAAFKLDVICILTPRSPGIF